MTTPLDDLQNYRPGSQGLYSLAVSTAAVATSTLTADYYYQVRVTQPVFWAAASTVTVGSTAGEYIGNTEWSLPFKARTGDKVHAILVAATAGRLYLRRLGQ